MKLLFNIRYLAITLLFVLHSTSYAGNYDDNGYKSKVTFECSSKSIPRASSRFKKIEKLAIDVDTKLCQSLLTLDNNISVTRDLLVDFGKQSESLLLERFSYDSVRSAINTQFGYYTDKILEFKGQLQNNDYPKLDVSTVDSSLYFTVPGRTKESIIANNFDPSCETVTGDESDPKPFNSCTQALEDAATAFNNYEVSVRRYATSQNDPKLEYLSNAWSRFLDKARSQTILDVWVTSAIHDDYYSQRKLVEPHPRQYFLLRPEVVYEFNPDTKKGDRNQLGLAVEWFGVNWWDAKIPFGVGLISVYADYEEADSIGHGLQFTFNNSTSIGWVNRGDTNGIFVTIDFLKLWEDKSDQLEQYKKDPWAWVRGV